MTERHSDVPAAAEAAEALRQGRKDAASKMEKLTDTELALAIQFCSMDGSYADMARSDRDCVKALLDARLAERAREQSESLVKATNALGATIHDAAKASGRLAMWLGIVAAVIAVAGVLVPLVRMFR